VLQNFNGASDMPATDNNFGGGDNTDSVLPPDPNGYVGLNHYVQWVNLHFTIYNKSGVKVYVLPRAAARSSRRARAEAVQRLD